VSAVRRHRAGALAIAIVALAVLTPVAAAAPARASLTDVENDVMCVVCNEPLAVAQSPQAYREKNFIRGLIAQGDTKAQIERTLVAVYGTAVLLAGIAILTFTLPRWRRKVRARAAQPTPGGPALTAAEQRRLDDELSHFAG